MKKLILLLALIGIVLTSCENGNDVDENNGTAPSVPQIELAQQIVEVEFEPNESAVLESARANVSVKDFFSAENRSTYKRV